MFDKENICCFFGHRHTPDKIKPLLYAEIEKHIVEKNVNVFYVGGYGDFDAMSAAALRELQREYPYIRVHRILAYIPGKKDEYHSDSYENTLYPDGLEFVPRKFAITHRNRWIVERSDYIIAYVLLGGGAYEALKYAERKNKSIVNLAESVVKMK